jgi:succinoglycan biosynthesis protein ExoA
MALQENPTVSIIVPCLNEARTIGSLLTAIYEQTYPRAALEVVIADGGSSDGTLAVIERFGGEHPGLALKVIENLKRSIPSALNLAISASRGEIIVRLDAHSIPNPDYVERSVAGLQSGAGDNVGGVWKIQPGSSTWIGRSIAAAAGHRLGVGDAQYRYATQAGPVDTVPFGAFYRKTFQRLGGFDETLLTNEDYEFNTRLRQSGGKVYLDPQIQSRYISRPDLAALARQYWRYGFWKWRMLRRYPHSLRWRQALPPVFVAGTIGLVILALIFAWARWLLLIEILAYFLILLVGALPTAFKMKSPAYLPGLPLAIATMHFAWGSGFIASILHPQH